MTPPKDPGMEPMRGCADGNTIHKERYCECEIAALRSEVDVERMRLAACGVVALADTPESAKRAREMAPEYRSASLGDVERRVDECITLRSELEEKDGLLRECHAYLNPECDIPRPGCPFDREHALIERIDKSLAGTKGGG